MILAPITPRVGKQRRIPDAASKICEKFAVSAMPDNRQGSANGFRVPVARSEEDDPQRAAAIEAILRRKR